MRFLVLLILLTTSNADAKPWLWQQRGEYLHDVEVAADGSIGAYANRELLRFSRDGKVLTRRGFPKTALVSAIAFAPNGELTAGGYFEKSLDLGGGEMTTEARDGFVARYKTDGKLRWRVQLRASIMAHVRSIAVTGDRVLAVGMFRRKVALGAKTLEADGDAGFVLLLDAQGEVLGFKKVRAELEATCTNGKAFVMGGRDRTNDDRVFLAGMTKELNTRWSYTGERGEVTDLACRSDGTSFAASYGQGLPPRSKFEDDVAVLEIDAGGKVVRTLPIITDGTDKPLAIATTATELVVTTSHCDGNSPVASRVTRFSAKGTLISADNYKTDETVWVRATYRAKDLVLAGEVQRGAKLRVRGTELTGPAVFVSAP